MYWWNPVYGSKLGKVVMTTDLQQAVVNILTENINPERSEARSNKANLPMDAVSNTTLASLRAFLEVHEALSDILNPTHYRTRHAGRTSTEGIGIAYFTRHLDDRTKVEIQSILLPTKQNWRGSIESYLRGHSESPITAPTFHNQPLQNEIRAGMPVFRVVGNPSSRLVEQLIASFSRSILFSDIR